MDSLGNLSFSFSFFFCMEFQDKNNANIAVKQSFMITTSSEQFQTSNCEFVETEVNLIPLTHMYMIFDSYDFVGAVVVMIVW